MVLIVRIINDILARPALNHLKRWVYPFKPISPFHPFIHFFFNFFTPLNPNPTSPLYIGDALICHRFGRNLIDAEILTGQFKGTRVFLPRIPLQTSEDAKLPFEFTRKQFPVRLSFALTINKSQGQTIPHVGNYLPDHVFSHGQLYVALSRGVSETTTKVLVKKGRIDGHEGVYTRNVVYPEIFAKLRNHR